MCFDLTTLSHGAQVAIEEMNKRQESGEVPENEAEALGMDVTAKVCLNFMFRTSLR